MIVVIEGPDCTGKTTLADAFVRQGYERVHNGPPKGDPFEEYTNQLLKYRGKDVVFDRLHLGEMVYGPVMRGGSKLSLHQFRLINRLLFAMGGIIIRCDTNTDQIWERWRPRVAEEYVQDAKKFEAIVTGFRQLAAAELDRSARVKTYNLNNHLGAESTDRYVHDITSVLSWYHDKLPDGVLGSTTAQYLVVGQQAGRNPDFFDADLPFYTDKRCSGFLNECLWEADYEEENLAFTNAITVYDSIRNLQFIYLKLDRPTVIALGTTAQDTCLKQGVPFLPMPHPQFVKRFQGTRRGRDRYIKTLRSFKGEAHG